MLRTLTNNDIIYTVGYVPYGSNSLSDKCSGDSVATFIRCDKLKSDNMFFKRDLIILFVKNSSTDAVVTGIVWQIMASFFSVFSVSFESVCVSVHTSVS